jgi:3'-phosphoadenosine 5'-phosphosulfate sulfotransferase (PAPS reductase)/FAD synthetase
MEEIDPPDSEEIERLWKEKPKPRPPTPPLRMMSDTQIYQAQQEHKRKYHREYYHNHKTLCGCEICGSVYVSMSSLRRHQGRSSKCKVQRLAKEVEELKGKLEGDTNPSP